MFKYMWDAALLPATDPSHRDVFNQPSSVSTVRDNSSFLNDTLPFNLPYYYLQHMRRFDFLQ